MTVGKLVPAPAGETRPPEEAARIRDAARQFEALMMGELLRNGRAGGSSGWMGTGEDGAGGRAMEFAEEHLAQALAAGGGLGLAHLVVRGLGSAGDPGKI